ncbi:unnamed protein product [Bursaphelenchus okinawaensis]|uniref:Tubulin gamma chain n=1 Tax=Bursaphelenchus okinawaensis TaxID=465554 RepID=A0A811LR62_9BILA|nr:unnamed protein product [Bursaphelenchus okinawaensis]CAG9128012.1 unnamed protein product [Bursaphelenchus okinawaensis]
MPHVISLQVGQCGNQLGKAFAEELCKQHGIGPDGATDQNDSRLDRKDVFFYESDSGRYIYRGIMADLEPRVLSMVQSSEYGRVYNPENVYSASDGGGAGNSWAGGYTKGSEAMESLMDIVQREAEASDKLECFMLTHSVSGGTGSGMGSRLLESLRDAYPKKMVQTYSVFPVKGESNVVVEPYNAILTTARLTEYADMVTVVDNKALDKMGVGVGKMDATFENMNTMVAQMMSMATAPLRYSATSCATFMEQIVDLCPFQPMHFIGTAHFPFNIPGRPIIAPKTTATDTLRRLLQPKSLMISATNSTRDPRYIIAGVVVFEGQKEDIDVIRIGKDAREKYRDLFPPTHPLGIRYLRVPPSPYTTRTNRVSGLLLANHTKFVNILDEITNGYDKLYAKNAFIGQYEKEYGTDFINDMGDSREKIETLKELYREVENDTFMRSSSIKQEFASMENSAENLNMV